MSGKPANSPADNQASTAVEVKSALSGFFQEFNMFQTDMKSKLKEQEDRLTMLDRKSVALERPVLSRHADTAEAPHQKAFNAYLRAGDEDAMRSLEFEEKAMTTTIAADGGFLVDPQMSEQIHAVLHSTSSIRSISNVVHVESTAYDVLIDHVDMGAGWVTETGNSVETGTAQLDRISIPLHELSALPKISQRLLDDSAFDLEGWLASRIADKFTRAEGQAFISGDGIDKPRGFLDYPSVQNDSWSWGSLGYVATGSAGDFSSSEPADAIVDLVYGLGARYRANATFVMNSKTAGAVRKMKDADGRFLWADGLASNEPSRLMGYKVLISEDMPDIANDAYAVAFGDFDAGYTIAERPDLRILRDPFSAKPHVLFYATKRVGGDVSDFNAIKVLKFATS